MRSLSALLPNSVAYVKITFSVFISSPLPLIRSYRIEFYFSVPAVRTRLEPRPLFCAGNLAACLWVCRVHAPATAYGMAGTDTVFTDTAGNPILVVCVRQRQLLLLVDSNQAQTQFCDVCISSKYVLQYNNKLKLGHDMDVIQAYIVIIHV